MDSFLSTPLRAVAVQVIETSSGIIIRRGLTQVAIEGSHAPELVRLVFSAATRPGGATPQQIADLFSWDEHEAIIDFLRQLHQRRLLLPTSGGETLAENETNLDVFHWQFGRSSTEVVTTFQSVTVGIAGLNRLTIRLASLLHDLGFGRVELIDDPLLRNPEISADCPQGHSEEWGREKLAEGRFSCLVAGSDFGGQSLLIPWNRMCLQNGVNFLPVILQEMTGWIGPFVIPGHTACLECFLSRQNSHLVAQQERRVYEPAATAGQQVVAWHPAMINVASDIASFELHRFYAELPRRRVGKVVHVNLFGSAMTARRVLRVPRCPACSSLHEGIPTNIHNLQPLSVVQSR